MTTKDDRWERVMAIFDEAVVLAGTKRDACIERTCGSDAALRSDVERLLLADADETPFPRTPVPGMAMALWSQWRHPIGETVGSYRLVRLVGVGGMGAVYEAVRADGAFEHRAAVKILNEVSAADEIVYRFTRERQVLASLNHPGIARLLDGGTLPSGLPYLIMEFIDGRPLDAYCDEHNLSVADRLRLFLKICDAVHHAHCHLVVHRDLKPNNILVTEEGIPKLVDFGISKLIEADSVATKHGQSFMTPQYASPEQIRGEIVSTGADVYALGVILYEILTGCHPTSSVSSVAGSTTSEPTSPDTPSRFVSERAATRSDGNVSDAEHWKTRGTTRQGLCAQLRGDLDTIVLTAMHVDPARRYGSVEGLAKDLENFLSGRPVTARRDSLLYRTGKFLRRNRALTAVSALAFVVLGISAVSVTVAYFRTTEALLRVDAAKARAEREAIAARRAADRASKTSDFLQKVLRAADPGYLDERAGPDLTVRDALVSAVKQMQTELAGEPELQATLYLTAGKAFTGIDLMDEALSCYQNAMQIAEKSTSVGSVEMAAIQRNLALLRLNQGEFNEAMTLAKEAYRLSKGFTENQRPELASATVALGLAHQANGDYVEAKRLLGEAVSLYEISRGPNCWEVAYALHHLGGAHFNMFELAASTEALQRALAIKQGIVGEGHSWVLKTMTELANVQSQDRRFKEAVPLYRKVLAAQRMKLGDHHSLVASTQNNLGMTIYRSGGDVAEAQELLSGALEARRETLGNKHARVATTLCFLAETVAYGKGQFDEGEKLFREAETAYDESLVDHPRRTQYLIGLGRLLVETGKLVEAGELIREARRIHQLRLPADHPFQAASLGAMAEHALAIGDLNTAESECRSALALLESRFEVDHAVNARFLVLFSKIICRTGDPKGAASYAERALNISRSWFGEDHVAAGQARLAHCEIALAQGDFNEAERQCQSCIRLVEERLGLSHPWLSEPKCLLGTIMMRTNRPDEARRNFASALALERRALDSGHPLIAQTLEGLAELHIFNGEQALAEPMLEEALAIRVSVFGADHPSSRRTSEVVNQLAKRNR